MNLKRRSFLAGLSISALLSLAESVPVLEQLPDDLAGSVTTHRIEPEDFYGYAPGLRIRIGESVGIVVAVRKSELDIKWS